MKKQASAVFLTALILAQAPAFAAIGRTSSEQASVSLTIPAHYNASLKNGTLCIQAKMGEAYRIVSSKGVVISESCPGGGTIINNADHATVSVVRIEPE